MDVKFAGTVTTHRSDLPHTQGKKFLPEAELKNYLLISQKYSLLLF